MKKTIEMTYEERIARIRERQAKREARPNRYEILELNGYYTVIVTDWTDSVIATKTYKNETYARKFAEKYSAIENK